jgi:hypothetical protein
LLHRTSIAPTPIKDGHHFDLARPDDPKTKKVDEGKEADKKIQKATDQLKKKGIN